MRQLPLLLSLAAGGLALATPAAAQGDAARAEAAPTCASQGVQRVAVMIPPRTWRTARFEPYVFEGCRVKAWLQVPQTFTSDWGYDRREVEVRTTPPR